MGGDGVLAHYVGVNLVLRQHQRAGPFGRARDKILAVLRVEYLQLFGRDVKDVGNLVEMDAALHMHRVCENGALVQPVL